MCLYYAHRTFKLQKIWQQQLKPVQKTTLQRSRSTSARPVVACKARTTRESSGSRCVIWMMTKANKHQKFHGIVLWNNPFFVTLQLMWNLKQLKAKRNVNNLIQEYERIKQQRITAGTE